MATRKRRRAVRIGVPALIVGVLTFGALWRLGMPGGDDDPSATTRQTPAALPPVGSPAEVLLPTSIGRQALLEDVPVLVAPSPRTLWIGDDAVRVFVVLDPDVKRPAEIALEEGARASFLGLVRRAPAPDAAVRQWGVDADTAEVVRDGGIYLHVTEIRAADTAR